MPKWEITYVDDWEHIEAPTAKAALDLSERDDEEVERVDLYGPDCNRCKDAGTYWTWDGRDGSGKTYCPCLKGQELLKAARNKT